MRQRLRQRLAKAEKSLETAEWALEFDDPDSCASRAYFAVYQVLLAFFESRGHRDAQGWTHDTLHNRFTEWFTKRAKVFPEQTASDVRYVWQMRGEADYEPESLDVKMARRALEKARDIVRRIREVLEK